MAYSTKAIKRQRQRDWLNGRRSAYFANKNCVVCSSRKQLQLDHVNPKLKIAHKIWSWKEPRRDAEIAKCQILCLECHKEKTRLEKYLTPYKMARVGGIKYIGVYRKTIKSEFCTPKWEAKIQIRRNPIYIGSFDTIEEAVNARLTIVKREIRKSPFYELFKHKI